MTASPPLLQRRLPHHRAIPVVLLLALLALTASCSGAGESDAGAGDDSVGVEEGGAGAAEMPEAAAERADLERADAESASSVAQAVRQRAVISTATVSLRETDVAATLLAVRKVIDTHRGEIAERESDTDDDGELAVARLVVRVPSTRFDAALDDLDALSDFSATTQSSEDVTTQVIDTEARVRAQTASLERVEALLGRAESLRDIVAIETQLTRRQADLDSLRSQQAWLADQTSMSTITVYLEQRSAGEPEEDPSGFLAGLRSGWQGLGVAATGLATVLGAVLPFAIVLAVVAGALYLLARRIVRRRPGRPATATPAGPQEP